MDKYTLGPGGGTLVTYVGRGSMHAIMYEVSQLFRDMRILGLSLEIEG